MAESRAQTRADLLDSILRNIDAFEEVAVAMPVTLVAGLLADLRRAAEFVDHAPITGSANHVFTLTEVEADQVGAILKGIGGQYPYRISDDLRIDRIVDGARVTFHIVRERPM